MISLKDAKPIEWNALMPGQFFIAMSKKASYLAVCFAHQKFSDDKHMGSWAVPLQVYDGSLPPMEKVMLTSFGSKDSENPFSTLVLTHAVIEVDERSISPEPTKGSFFICRNGHGVVTHEDGIMENVITSGTNNESIRPMFFSRWGIRVGDELIEINPGQNHTK